MTSVIYFVQREGGDVKIGTTVNLGQRLSTLRGEHGNIKLLGIIKGNYVKEKILHWCLSDSRLDGEWFILTDEIQNIINTYSRLPEPKKAALKLRIPSSARRRPIGIRLNVRLVNAVDILRFREGSPFYGQSRTRLIEHAIKQTYQDKLND